MIPDCAIKARNYNGRGSEHAGVQRNIRNIHIFDEPEAYLLYIWEMTLLKHIRDLYSLIPRRLRTVGIYMIEIRFYSFLIKIPQVRGTLFDVVFCNSRWAQWTDCIVLLGSYATKSRNAKILNLLKNWLYVNTFGRETRKKNLVKKL